MSVDVVDVHLSVTSDLSGSDLAVGLFVLLSEWGEVPCRSLPGWEIMPDGAMEWLSSALIQGRCTALLEVYPQTQSLKAEACTK